MRYPDILTPRLRLVYLSQALMRFDRSLDRPGFSKLLKAQVPAEWPPEHWEPHCFDFLTRIYREHPYAREWSRYVVLRDEPVTLIGTVGAFPRGDNEAEIGYGLLPAWQRQGLATEAAQALVAQLFTNKRIETISAQTFPHHNASIRVMEKCGLLLRGFGVDEGTICYSVQRQAR